jgi:hypothetical protein
VWLAADAFIHPSLHSFAKRDELPLLYAKT